MIKLGRNDPCHCGSGKKYKKCHLDADQRDRAAMHSAPPEQESDSTPEPESPSATVDVQNLPGLLERVSKKGSASQRKKINDLLSKAGPLLEYLTHQSEIDAAGEALEPHRAEFEKLLKDEDRLAAFARSVFSEDCFAPMRFSAEDVKSAFDQVGYPAMMSPDDRTVQTLRAAILHVTSKERRRDLSMQLLLMLPEFVAAGRHLEGWLVRSAAYDTSEHGQDSNTFLFQMFSYGYDAWAANKQAENESLLRQLGLDPDALRSMSLDELDSWVQSRTSDPANARAMEEFFHKNPHMREESEANLRAMERNSAKLLDGKDSHVLLLPFEEVRPWLTLLNQRATEKGFLSGVPNEESARGYFKEVASPLLREMAGAVFTTDRVRRLVTDLKKYRAERFAAGHSETAALARSVISDLEREDSPADNGFLLTLCWHSLGSAIEALAVETDRAPDPEK